MKLTARLLCSSLLMFSSVAFADSVTLQYIPAYSWYHGCGPTAAASIIGYWDMAGYSGLFDASGADVYLTEKVQDQISSPAHNAKYDGNPDDPNLSDPPDTSIADYFHTSEGGLGYGWSYESYAPNAFVGYAAYRGYNFNAWDVGYGAFSWSSLVSEINSQYPLMFLVDTNGDAVTDHFVPVIGYDDRGLDGQWYGAYTTWGETETVQWFQFHGMTADESWGIGYVTYVHPNGPVDSEPIHVPPPQQPPPQPPPDPPPNPSTVPEPSGLLLVLSGAAAWTTVCRKKK